MGAWKDGGGIAKRPSRSAAGVSYAVMAITLGLGSWWISRAWPLGPDGFAAEVSGPRSVVGADLLECAFSEEWEELADAIERLPAPPDWLETRRLMEERGRASLRYSLHVRWWLDDGRSDLLIYNGTPHDEPHRLAVFLGALRCARRRGVSAGEPIRSIDLSSRDPSMAEGYLEALVDAPRRGAGAP